jgi:hypothetical protein
MLINFIHFTTLVKDNISKIKILGISKNSL